MRAAVADSPPKLVTNVAVLSTRSLCMLSKHNPIEPAAMKATNKNRGRHMCFIILLMTALSPI